MPLVRAKVADDQLAEIESRLQCGTGMTTSEEYVSAVWFTRLDASMTPLLLQWRSDKANILSARYRMRTSFHRQLGEDVLRVRFDSLWCDLQRSRNALI